MHVKFQCIHWHWVSKFDCANIFFQILSWPFFATSAKPQVVVEESCSVSEPLKVFLMETYLGRRHFPGSALASGVLSEVTRLVSGPSGMLAGVFRTKKKD